MKRFLSDRLRAVSLIIVMLLAFTGDVFGQAPPPDLVAMSVESSAIPAPASPMMLLKASTSFLGPDGAPTVIEGITPLFQTPPMNPTIAEWTASTDHAVTFNPCVPPATACPVNVLDRYDIEVYVAAGTGAALRTINAGKPLPGAAQFITYNQLATGLAGLANGPYAVKVAAVGPGGTSRSALSNPFSQLGSPAVTPAPVVR